MSKYTSALLGFCCASILRGLRGGLRDLASASAAAARAAADLPCRQVHSIPSLSLEQILGSRKLEVHLTIQGYDDGMLPTEQLLILLALLVAEQPQAVLEIGTFMGYTSKAMAMNLPGAIIHTVDLPPDFVPDLDPVSRVPKDDFHLITKRKVGREYLGTEYATRIRQHFGDTATWDFQEASGATFFFIDGSHTYDYCRNDSDKCLELCNGKGVFLWHDCDDRHPGVTRMIHEWRALGRDIVRVNGTALAYWKSVPG
jgi:hypothetical protein